MDDHPPTYEEAMELNVPPPTYEEAMEPPSHFDIFGEAAPTNETTTIEIQGNVEIEDQIQIQTHCEICFYIFLILFIIAIIVYLVYQGILLVCMILSITT